MIPQRVRLKGFLCYKDEQLIEFDGNATLWMLSGLNGSGKSAIFDAVTYALFGYHRGGSMHAHELINKDSDTLLVEFDFLLDKQLYRAKRTLKRDAKGGARGTQQMFRYQDGGWTPVPDTAQRREFDAWVEENVGLRYETFTSSVLLLQGKAERLLDSKPEGRREVLASIVDLGRYERLHQKADERRKTQEGALKALQGRLAALPAVAPLELQEAKTHILDAEEAREKARAEVERLLGMEAQVKQWQDLQARLVQAKTRWQKAKGVLADAAAIEQAVARLRELREILPRLKEIARLRSQALQAEEQLRFQQREHEKQVAALAQKEATLKQARGRRTMLHGQIARDEASYRDVAGNLRKLTAQLATLRECERLENDLNRLSDELNRLPADPVALVSMAREAYDRLDAIDRQMPVLTRFVACRNELRQAVQQEKHCEEVLQAVRARGEEKKAEVEALRPRLEEAQARLQAANDQATEARTILAQAKQSLDELLELSGAKVCRHCGQTLTPGHLGEEKQRRMKAVQEAEARGKQAGVELEAARQAEAKLREKLERADKAYQEAREEYRDHNRQLTSARTAVEKCQRQCGHIWHELPEAYRQKVSATAVADWLATSYPQEADLEALRVQVRELAPARAKLREAEKVQQVWSGLKAQEGQARESLNCLLRDLPQDRQAIRRQHADLEAKEKALFNSMDALREQVKEVEREIEQLTRDRDEAQAELSRLDTWMKERQLIRQNAEHNMQIYLKALPAAWQTQAEAVGLRELHTLTGELEQLEEEDTEERGRELEYARHNVTVLEKEVQELERQEAAMPPEARQDLAAIKAKLAEARAADRLRDEELAAARKRLALLEDYQRQRQQLDEECRQVEAELASHRLLAELLGKDRLQLYLVRQAERQVVEYANAVLDRLSGGQLYLKLAGEANGEGASAKALDLEAYNRATGERPINVAFLSGSQKFRVAVSLALGIGQYASRQHRPIESVIIDEGFGCLDSQGRQVMIQELQNLRSQMRCILLVSHQEDFAESFSDGYHFQLENGATRVRRFQK